MPEQTQGINPVGFLFTVTDETGLAVLGYHEQRLGVVKVAR